MILCNAPSYIITTVELLRCVEQTNYLKILLKFYHRWNPRQVDNLNWQILCRNLTSRRYVCLFLIGFPLYSLMVNRQLHTHILCIHSPCTGVFSTLTVSEIKIVYQLNLERCFTLFWNTFPLVVKKWLIKWNWQEHFWKAWNKQHKICCMYAMYSITIINDLIHYIHRSHFSMFVCVSVAMLETSQDDFDLITWHDYILTL